MNRRSLGTDEQRGPDVPIRVAGARQRSDV